MEPSFKCYKRQKKKKEERQALEGELQVIQEAAVG